MQLQIKLPKRKKKKKTQPADTDQDETPVENDIDVEVREDGTINANGVEISYDDAPGDMTPNSWTGRFTMETSEYKNGKEKDRTVTHMHFDTYQSAIVIEDEKSEASVVIFDKRNRTMTTKTDDDGKKQAVVMRMPRVTVNTDEVYEDIYDEGKLPHATGEYKMINNQRCQRYTYEDDEVVGEAWISEGSGPSMMDIFGSMNLNPTGKAAKPPKGSAFSFSGGMVYESTSTDKRSGRISKMSMRNVIKNGQDPALFNLNGYNVVKVPNMGNLFKPKNQSG